MREVREGSGRLPRFWPEHQRVGLLFIKMMRIWETLSISESVADKRGPPKNSNCLLEGGPLVVQACPAR